MLRGVKTTSTLSLAMAIGLSVWACGGNQPAPPPSPGVYYNLTPGLCAEYSNDAGGGGVATVGVHIVTATNPPGIELKRYKHGLQNEFDFLNFAPDGGDVFLAERELFPATGPTQEFYSTTDAGGVGLKYLPAPPLGSQTLDSSSDCANGSACMDMALDVSVLSTSPYTGAYSVPDGGMIETQLYFTYTYNGDGGLAADQRGVVPGIGFTDLYMIDDTMNLSHYLLVDIIPDDGGCGEH